MSRPKTHLISCVCSADIPVSVGQAGDRVACPACGREADVPKLREFGGLRRNEAAISSAQTPWTAAHAALLCGGVLAVLAGAGVVLVQPRANTVVTAEAIRAAVRAADDREIYKAWKESLSRSGVRRPPTPEEQSLERQARFAAGVSRALLALAAVGGIAAAAAAFRVFPGRPVGGTRSAGSSSSGGRQ